MPLSAWETGIRTFARIKAKSRTAVNDFRVFLNENATPKKQMFLVVVCGEGFGRTLNVNAKMIIKQKCDSSLASLAFLI